MLLGHKSVITGQRVRENKVLFSQVDEMFISNNNCYLKTGFEQYANKKQRKILTKIIFFG